MHVLERYFQTLQHSTPWFRVDKTHVSALRDLTAVAVNMQSPRTPRGSSRLPKAAVPVSLMRKPTQRHQWGGEWPSTLEPSSLDSRLCLPLCAAPNVRQKETVI